MCYAQNTSVAMTVFHEMISIRAISTILDIVDPKWPYAHILNFE